MNSLFYKTYKILTVLEAALLIGLLQFFLEGKITGMKISVYLRVAAIMLMVGGIFSIVFYTMERFIKNTLVNITGRTTRHGLRFAIHGLILTLLFAAYAYFYFNVRVL